MIALLETYDISLGEMILLNSIINDILIFFMSFWKMYVKIWKNIFRIQRRFHKSRVIKGDSRISLLNGAIFANLIKEVIRVSELSIWLTRTF